MTVLINFLGAPGVGKTSLSSEVFAKLKQLDLNVEFVSEFVKTWAWQDRKVEALDQYYIFGKEVNNQSRLLNKVDYIIADSPVLLTGFYLTYYTGKSYLDDATKDFYEVLKNTYSCDIYNFFLRRKKKYNPKGRFQTQEESDKMSQQLQQWLDSHNYDYTLLDCTNKERLNKVLEVLNLERMVTSEVIS